MRQEVDGMDLTGFLELARQMNGPVQLDQLTPQQLAVIMAQFALHLDYGYVQKLRELSQPMYDDIVRLLKELHPNSIAASEKPYVYLCGGPLDGTGVVGFDHSLAEDEIKLYSDSHGNVSLWLVRTPQEQ